MVNIMRVTAEWTGFPGGPGFSVFHMRDFGSGTGPGADPTLESVNGAMARIRQLFIAFAPLLAPPVSVQVRPVVDILEDTTGTLVDSLSGTPVTPVLSSATGNYSAPAGAVINWRTNGIRNGRRIRGRTFLVPLAGSSFDGNGSLSTSAQTTIQNAANVLVDTAGTPDLGVYARPSSPLASDGQWVLASSATVPDMAALLTSRRD